MVSLKDVRASNASFKESKDSLTAVFIGGTSGIGMATLKHLTLNAHAPKIYIVGRSKKASETLLNELASSNRQADLVFLETQISLMRNVDQVCEEIKAKESKLDLLFMSPGYLTFEGRNETPEGIDVSQAVRYYARLRFAYNLLPLLNASPAPRIVGILAGGKETELDFDDLELRKKFDSFKAAGNGTTQTSLAFEELAKSNPNVTFIHKFPGVVATGGITRLMMTAKGIWAIPARLATWVLVPIVELFSTSVNVAGERGLFISTSARYPPSQPKLGTVGTSLPKGVEIAKASVVVDGHGNGVYLLNENDDSAPDAAVMVKYRQENKGKLVWESTMDVWERALARA